jgi:hypothetical protein
MAPRFRGIIGRMFCRIMPERSTRLALAGFTPLACLRTGPVAASLTSRIPHDPGARRGHAVNAARCPA